MKIKLDIPLSLSEIAKSTGGILTHGDAVVSNLCTDSREAENGDLFIAISGKRIDGNEFAEEARARGAYVLGNRLASILVSDTADAIMRLVSLYKRKLPRLMHTVAITGSVGKTTTKELTAALLSCKYSVHSNLGNYNNDIGLLHTVLSAKRETEVLVVEMGMNHKGEISRLSRATEPDTAIITNVGTAHIGNLGSREAIALAKLEIADGMNGGVILIPHGERLLNAARSKREVSVNNPYADYSLLVEQVEEDGTVFSFGGKQLCLESERIALVGEHLMWALAFATSAADTLGIRGDEIAPALRSINSERLRQRRIKVGRYDIYDDTYSSSPEAAIAVMRVLTRQNKKGVSAVLGDMLELGGESDELHRKVGEAAAKCGVRKLYPFGKFAQRIAEGAVSAGMPAERIFLGDQNGLERTAEQIRISYDGELLIVKASHAVHAERIYDFLKD